MTTRTSRTQLLTVPNLLSLARLSMIPLFVLLYLKGQNTACAIVLALSGATDLVDGWFARHFDAVTDIGKILDPVADKLTLAAALGMLVSVHPSLTIPLVLLVIKELVMGMSGAAAILHTGEVHGAVWHGKITTALTYVTMFIHVLWQDITPWASNILSTACSVMMLLSLALYTLDNIRRIRSGRGGS